MSVDAIYGLHGRRYFNLKKTYNSLYRIYPDREPAVLPDHILTEDSNSGYQFFCKIAESRKIQCSSANGNSNLLSAVKTMENKTVLVIADGAAFGSVYGDDVGLSTAITKQDPLICS